jgi:hypothetical protein
MVLYEDTGTKYIDEDLNIKVALSYVIWHIHIFRLTYPNLNLIKISTIIGLADANTWQSIN